MDSLPQETIDEIINNLPRSSLHSSSLVAKPWRKTSQKRLLRVIRFPKEAKVKSWYKYTRNDPDGVASYVEVAKFRRITEWSDPTLFIRVLKSFTSLTKLLTLETEIPDEIVELLSLGEFGRKITVLNLRIPRCSISTVISMSLSLPNLQSLSVDYYRNTSRETPSTHPILPRREPLNLLFLSGNVDEVVEALANSQFTSRRLFFDFRIQNIQKILIPSSVIIQELMLIDDPDRQSSHRIDLPPLPALTCLRIFIFPLCPSPQLIDVLSSISSVPALASIFIECKYWSCPEPGSSNTWADLDGWLALMAKDTTVEGGLVLTLMGWPRGEQVDAFFPKFREVGEIKTDSKKFDW